MGRPALDEEKRKSYGLLVRLDANDKKNLEELSEFFDLSRSATIRLLINSTVKRLPQNLQMPWNSND